MGDTAGEGWQASSTTLEPRGPEDALARAHAGFRGAGDHGGELVAADPEDLLVGSHGAHQHARERREHVVTGGVAAGVVDALEFVDVEHCDGDGVIRAGLGEHLLEVLVEGAAVREAGQRIAPGLCEGQGQPAFLGERRGGEVGDVADEMLVQLELHARRHRDQQRAEAGAIRDQRQREHLAARDAEPVELGKLVRISMCGGALLERAEDDPGCAREPVTRRRAREAGE